ncbi:MAG: hypothetical protein V4719_02890 [Planctomycetota bacterium]
MAYKLHPRVEAFFKDFINSQFESHDESAAWVKEVASRKGDWRHHSSLIERGQSSFTKEVEGLSTRDQVLIYCYYYMQMHTVSGFHVFKNAFKNQDIRFLRNLVLVDFGCGPITSAISMAWYNLANKKKADKLKVNYIGIDLSKAMRLFGNEVWTGAKDLFHDESTIDIMTRSKAQSGLVPLIEDYRQDRKLTICLNCSYYFGSESLNVDYLISLIRNLLTTFPEERVCLVFQNADNPYKNFRWEEFKGKTEDVLFPRYADTFEQLSYNDVTAKRLQGNPHRIKLRHAVLLNHVWKDELEKE